MSSGRHTCHRRAGKSCGAAGDKPRRLLKAADELAKHVGVKPACAALEVSRSTLYRRRGPSTGQQQPRPTPARALSETERGEVFDTLCSERFVDRSPAEVVATLLDEEVYLCSERTMYRVLASEVPVQERRAQRTHSLARRLLLCSCSLSLGGKGLGSAGGECRILERSMCLRMR